MERHAEMPFRERAERLAQIFASLPAVEAVCLFGSAARGDVHPASDIDLLVLGSDAELSPAALIARLPAQLREVRLSLLYYSRNEFRKMLATGSPFAEHLRREALVLHDRTGALTTLLKHSDSDTDTNVERELRTRLAQLRIYGDLQPFRGNFLFVLSHLYSIGKSIVMLALVAEGAPEFNREVAFAKFIERHPDMASEVAMVSSLRPFHLLVTRRSSEPLPFSRYDAEREVRDAIAAIRRLASVLQ